MNTYQGPFFYFQLGHQDQRRCLEMAQRGYGKGAILSPTHLSERALSQYANDFSSAGREVLFDPQMFDPRNFPRRDREEVPQFANTHELSDTSNSAVVIEYFLRWQQDLNVSKFIVPCPTANPFTSEWIRILFRLNEQAQEWVERNEPGKPRLATLILSEDVIASETARHEVLNNIVGFNTFDVEGFYVVFDARSLQTNEDAVYGMLDLVFRLKQHLFSVLIGFADFWAMLALPFGLDAFGGGSWQRSRVFQSNQWRGERDTGPRRRAKRYRSALLLGDVRFPEEAELLREVGMWEELNNSSPYALPVFSGISPAAIEASNQWTEGNSHQNTFWQFLTLIHKFVAKTRSERIAIVRKQLTNAEEFFVRASRNHRQLQNNGQYLAIWRGAFERYLSEVAAELEDEFD